MTDPHFDGKTYEPEHDQVRLTGMLHRVHALMTDQRWRTHGEIAKVVGSKESSIGARLRDLRKEKYGSMIVERRARGDRAKGLFEYRVVIPVKDEPHQLGLGF